MSFYFQLILVIPSIPEFKDPLVFYSILLQLGVWAQCNRKNVWTSDHSPVNFFMKVIYLLWVSGKWYFHKMEDNQKISQNWKWASLETSHCQNPWDTVDLLFHVHGASEFVQIGAATDCCSQVQGLDWSFQRARPLSPSPRLCSEMLTTGSLAESEKQPRNKKSIWKENFKNSNQKNLNLQQYGPESQENKTLWMTDN